MLRPPFLFLALCILALLPVPGLASGPTAPASGTIAPTRAPVTTGQGSLTNQAGAATNRIAPGPISASGYFRLGGIFMYPLLLLAAAGLALVSERLIFALRRPAGSPAFARELVQSIRRGGIPAGQTLCAGQPRLALARVFSRGLAAARTVQSFEKEIETQAGIELAARERGLGLLSGVATIAPLLGFLGTVTGMIASFQSIASAESLSVRVVSGGIFEALITTAAGLIVAIPAFAYHNYAVHRIDRFAATIEHTVAEITASLEDAPDATPPPPA